MSTTEYSVEVKGLSCFFLVDGMLRVFLDIRATILIILFLGPRTTVAVVSTSFRHNFIFINLEPIPLVSPITRKLSTQSRQEIPQRIGHTTTEKLRERRAHLMLKPYPSQKHACIDCRDMLLHPPSFSMQTPHPVPGHFLCYTVQPPLGCTQ